jgi:ribosomal protein L22
MSAEDEQEELKPEEAAAGEPTAEAPKKPARARKAATKAEQSEDKGEESPAEDEEAPATDEEAATVGKAEGEEAAAKKPAKARRRKAKAAKPEADAEEQPAADAEEPAAEEESVAESPLPARTGAPVARRAVVSARARYVRTSARKARMVCGHLRGKSVQEARAILAFTPRDVARDWSKLLESAVANAENNHELLEDDLVVREAYADEGPTIKRFRPRAMGRATPIRKRTSHLTITLTPRP